MGKQTNEPFDVALNVFSYSETTEEILEESDYKQTF